MSVKDWSTTAGSNTAVGAVSIAEGMAPGDVNDAIREIMAQVAAVIGATGISYLTGQGGSVTQVTSKSTSVTLNKLCGQITTTADALASGSSVGFNLVNSMIGTTDVVIANVWALVDKYRVRVGNLSVAGQCAFVLENVTGGTLSEAVTINFMVLKGVNS
jgi:hypothetical protein